MDRRDLKPTTRLSELRQQPPSDETDGTARLVRSVQQSMRAEGYPISETDVRASAARVLKNDAK